MFNEKTRQYVGRGKVMGRIAGQFISLMFTLLKLDQQALSKTPSGTKLPDPVLYDPEIYRKHRERQYRSSTQEKPRKVLHMHASALKLISR